MGVDGARRRGPSRRGPSRRGPSRRGSVASADAAASAAPSVRCDAMCASNRCGRKRPHRPRTSPRSGSTSDRPVRRPDLVERARVGLTCADLHRGARAASTFGRSFLGIGRREHKRGRNSARGGASRACGSDSAPERQLDLRRLGPAEGAPIRRPRQISCRRRCRWWRQASAAPSPSNVSLSDARQARGRTAGTRASATPPGRRCRRAPTWRGVPSRGGDGGARRSRRGGGRAPRC